MGSTVLQLHIVLVKSHLVNFDEMQRHLEQSFENEKLTPSPHRNLLINVKLEKHVFSSDCGLLESYWTLG